MRRFAAIAVVLALAPHAHADTLVMRSEGRADKAARAQIEAAVLALAATTGPASAGEITFAEAAVTVGCKPEDAACKDEVLGLLAVDEVVTIAAEPKPGGIEVTVRRITRGGWTRGGSALVPADRLAQLDALAPLFRGTAAASITATPAATTPMPAPQPTEPAIVTGPVTPEPTAPPAAPSPATVQEPTPSVVDTAPGSDAPPRRERLPKIGMVAGGTLALVGIVFWASAASTSNEIDGLPTRTREDLLRIKDLEDEADGYAAAGNLLVLAGVVAGGVSAYYFVKGRRARRALAARITPAVFGDGAGIAVTFGGTP